MATTPTRSYQKVYNPTSKKKKVQVQPSLPPAPLHTTGPTLPSSSTSPGPTLPFLQHLYTPTLVYLTRQAALKKFVEFTTPPPCLPVCDLPFR